MYVVISILASPIRNVLKTCGLRTTGLTNYVLVLAQYFCDEGMSNIRILLFKATGCVLAFCSMYEKKGW